MLVAKAKANQPVPRLSKRRSAAGFSLIEIVIVIALIAFIYSVAMPELNLRSGSEVATKLNTLAGDVRSAADLAVLTSKTYRLVFMFNSGDYWLEEADKADILLGSDKVDRDPTEMEEKDEAAAFDQKFEEYKDLAGQEVPDPKGDKPIPPTSPVLTARSRLKRPKWTKVESLEWTKRSLGPYLMVRDLQSEHHGRKQDISELGAEARGMIYIFPNGYVQRAVIHVAFKKDDLVVDESQEPYTVTTNPYEGTADVVPGYQEVDVHADKDD